ncbi:glycerol kinase [bacterium CPR1]|nr:glycerol kinase [bacterium CPR1]
MPQDLLLALDQGTTGTTCLLLDLNLNILARAYREFEQIYPRAGWVSHRPEDLWQTSLATLREVVQGIDLERVAALGLTNQRETTLLWDRETGLPVHHAIVWQCRRSADIVEGWRNQLPDEEVQRRTGLIPDAYFSASKVAWMLEHVEGLRERCQTGSIAFGTVDSWLLWQLTEGRVHATEPSNASRTMLYNLNTLKWDEDLCQRWQIPMSILPEVRPSAGPFGVIARNILGREIPITGMAGDQQAALFGQACFEPGQVKNTYGTGCFLVQHTGSKPVFSKHRLLTTVAWQTGAGVEYALEGSVFSAGSAVQWLRDGLGLLKTAAESEELARAVADSQGVYLVPAFTGLGAPYWDPYARGTLVGLTRGTRREHLVRATLESVAYQTRDVVEAMAADAGRPPGRLRVDGGMCANDFLMQFQADVLEVAVERPRHIESTALGAACLAGLGAGVFASTEEIGARRQVERVFEPSPGERKALLEGWRRAVERSRAWVTVLLVFFLSCLAWAQLELQDMRREARWLRMSAERLYTFTPLPAGPEWQMSPNMPGSFMEKARQFESAWNDPKATLETTRDEFARAQKSFEKVKLYARINMNAQEVEIIEHQMERLDTFYGSPLKLEGDQ